MEAIRNRRLIANSFKPPHRLKISFANGEDDQIAVFPDPHETEKDDTIIEHSTCVDDDSIADEEILRPNLGTQAGASCAREMESLLDSLLSSKSGQPGEWRGKIPQFPGVTEEIATSSEHDDSPRRRKFKDMGTAVDEVTDMASELEDLMGRAGSRAEEAALREWKPIHFAAQKGNANVIKAYIERGALVDSREATNWTPLMLAAQNDRLEACRVLLNYGADINAANDNGHTPLVQAAFFAGADVVRLLLSEGADVSSRTNIGWTPFFTSTIRSLKDGDREVPLQVARVLLEAGADPNTPDNGGASPLYAACMWDYLDVIEFLLSNGADPNKIGSRRTSLYVACLRARPDIITLLIQYGADANMVANNMQTPLQLTVQVEEALALDAARALVRGGADIDAVTDEGVTPLVLAVQANRLDVAQFLLSEGAQQIDYIRSTPFGDVWPLETAVAQSNLDMVDLLLEYGARTDLVDQYGFNIVHIAAMQDDIDVFRRILDTGADIDLVSSDGLEIRPLHPASRRDNEEFAMMLLERGVMP